jgi:hypothetical protein
MLMVVPGSLHRVAHDHLGKAIDLARWFSEDIWTDWA